MDRSSKDVAYFNGSIIDVNEQLLPVIFRHMSTELAMVLNRKFKGAPNNRATRRQMEREVTDWIMRKKRKSFIRLAENSELEIVPEDFPMPVREHLPELVDYLNEHWGDADTSEFTLRRMSKDIEKWAEHKLAAIYSEGGVE